MIPDQLQDLDAVCNMSWKDQVAYDHAPGRHIISIHVQSGADLIDHFMDRLKGKRDIISNTGALEGVLLISIFEIG